MSKDQRNNTPLNYIIAGENMPTNVISILSDASINLEDDDRNLLSEEYIMYGDKKIYLPVPINNNGLLYDLIIHIHDCLCILLTKKIKDIYSYIYSTDLMYLECYKWYSDRYLVWRIIDIDNINKLADNYYKSILKSVIDTGDVTWDNIYTIINQIIEKLREDYSNKCIEYSKIDKNIYRCGNIYCRKWSQWRMCIDICARHKLCPTCRIYGWVFVEKTVTQYCIACINELNKPIQTMHTNSLSYRYKFQLTKYDGSYNFEDIVKDLFEYNNIKYTENFECALGNTNNNAICLYIYSRYSNNILNKCLRELKHVSPVHKYIDLLTNELKTQCSTPINKNYFIGTGHFNDLDILVDRPQNITRIYFNECIDAYDDIKTAISRALEHINPVLIYINNIHNKKEWYDISTIACKEEYKDDLSPIMKYVHLPGLCIEYMGKTIYMVTKTNGDKMYLTCYNFTTVN